ncbi:UNVERIFIED_CONTAM: hypothetical protein FKN15_013510 [Acipenser sinensis]
MDDRMHEVYNYLSDKNYPPSYSMLQKLTLRRYASNLPFKVAECDRCQKIGKPLVVDSTLQSIQGGKISFRSSRRIAYRSWVYPLNDSYAAACGFTYSFNLPGDLIFRASFLACHVESVNDVSYALQYRFVRRDSLGRETVYPFSLSCSTESPWNPREIVCEDNYMEVSVRKNVPVIAQEGLEKEDWEAALSIAQGAVMSVWQVVFHQTRMPPKTMTAEDARTAGYLVNSTSSRVVFRSPYGMPMSELLLAQGAVMSVWQVVFHQTRMPPKTMTAEDARTAGYLVNSTSSRVVFRSPYGMPMSELLLVNAHVRGAPGESRAGGVDREIYKLSEQGGLEGAVRRGAHRGLCSNALLYLQVSGIPVEAIRATVFYKQRWMLLLVDTSAACAKNPSVFDGTYLSWVTPRLLAPLVLHPTKFLDKRITMGVEGRALDEVAATSRGYQLLVNRTAVEIRIPFGAVGGYRKSHVIDNKYNQVYEIDLFLEHQWADDLWEVTQHRSFKPARSPYLPETPYVVNNTVPSEKGFTVTLGNFKPDVELKNLTLNGVPLTRPEAQNRGVKISEVLHPNGTKDFVLKVPFDNLLVSVEVRINPTLIRRYQTIEHKTIPMGGKKPPVHIHWSSHQEVHLEPDVKSFCTNRSVVFEVTPGNMDSSWELCIGSRPLPYTIAEPKITIELPLFSIGYIYEDISLRGLTVRVELNMRNVKTLQVEKQFVQRCPIPTRELLVCFPNGVVTVVAVTMEPIPVVDPSKTTLLDKTCKPKEFDSTRALHLRGEHLWDQEPGELGLPAWCCGSRQWSFIQIVGNYLIYENEVLYTRALFPPNAPVITRDSEYRLTIRCRYPLNDTLTLAAERKAAKNPRDVLNLKARLARDVSYSQFYSAFPVSQSLLEPVFLQVELLQPHNQTDRLILQDCWATLTPELDSSPQWDLVTDRLAVTPIPVSAAAWSPGDSYRTHFHPVLASTLPRSSPQLQRLEVRAQQSSKDSAFWRQGFQYFQPWLRGKEELLLTGERGSSEYDLITKTTLPASLPVPPQLH